MLLSRKINRPFISLSLFLYTKIVKAIISKDWSIITIAIYLSIFVSIHNNKNAHSNSIFYFFKLSFSFVSIIMPLVMVNVLFFRQKPSARVARLFLFFSIFFNFQAEAKRSGRMALLKGDLKRRAQLLDKLKAAVRAVLAAREEQGLNIIFNHVKNKNNNNNNRSQDVRRTCFLSPPR